MRQGNGLGADGQAREAGVLRAVKAELTPAPATLLGHLQDESLPAFPRADECYVSATPSPDQPNNSALRRECDEVHEVYPAVEERMRRALLSVCEAEPPEPDEAAGPDRS